MASDFSAAIGEIPIDWAGVLGPGAYPDRMAAIANFVADRRRAGPVLPAPEQVFAALRATPFDLVRAVILGQDPYPNKRDAMGLAFSVPSDRPPPLPGSLENIRKELQSDLGLALPEHGSLEAWTRHGVFLLNTSLTVDEGRPDSHGQTWRALTDAMIAAVATKNTPVAFLLWGKHAQVSEALIDQGRHVVVESSHPSPRSQRGFLGTRPFSRANHGLEEHGASPIDWSLT